LVVVLAVELAEELEVVLVEALEVEQAQDVDEWPDSSAPPSSKKNAALSRFPIPREWRSRNAAPCLRRTAVL